MVDYVVDGGEYEEELFATKREAMKRAQQVANEKGEPIYVYRWARPDRESDMELDEGGITIVEPKGEQA